VGTLALAFGAIAVVSAGVLLAACLRLGSTVGLLLATYLLASGEIIIVSLLLSVGRWLTRPALLAAVGELALLAILIWARLGRPRPPFSAGTIAALREASRDRAVVALAVLAVIAHVYLVASALTVPQSSPDTLLYHLPRAALWKQQQAVAYVANVPDERVDAAPPIAEIEIAASMILSEGDRYATLVQLVALLAACVGIAGIACRLGLGIRAAMFASFLFSTYSLVALQTPTALNDLALAAPLVVCAYFAMGTTRTQLALAALGLALALGTKLTTVLALPVLAVFVLSYQPRRRWPALAMAGIAGAVVGCGWYLVNLASTGKLDGGLTEAFPQTPDRGISATAERTRRLLMDLLELSGAEGKGVLRWPWLGIVACSVLLVVALVLAARGKHRQAAVAAVAVVFTVVAVPMLAVWVDVARRAVRQVEATIGLSAAPGGFRVPEQLYESPVHSAYGLAFVLLLIGAGTLVVRDVVCGRLAVAAVIALAGLPLFLVLLALTLEYDPARMRFFAFPVALATAVFGIALRVRLLAWAAVALTAVSLAVSLGYFAPRPAGLALLPGNRDTNRAARWLVQGESGKGDPAAFRFLEEAIPADATLALSVWRDTYLYPAWDSRLRRTVVFAQEDGSVPGTAGWLVVGPRQSVATERLLRTGWRLELASEGGWRVFRR